MIIFKIKVETRPHSAVAKKKRPVPIGYSGGVSASPYD